MTVRKGGQRAHFNTGTTVSMWVLIILLHESVAYQV
jgi:hypothetical protein